MSADPFKLGVWVRSQNRRAALFRLSLVARLEGGDQFSQLGEWPGPVPDNQLEATVAEWQEQASADASAFPGRTCTYVLEAVGENGALRGSRRFNARGAESSAAGGPTESPSAHGLLAQMMRHLEASQRLQVEAKLSILSDAERLMAMAQKQIEAAYAENATLRARERETVELFANLKSGENSFRLQQAQLEIEAKNSAEGRARFWGIATPLIMSKIAPGAPSALPPGPPAGGGAPPAPMGDVSPRAAGDAAAPVDPVAVDLMAAFAQAQVPIEAIFNGAPPELQRALGGFVQKYGPELRRQAAAAPTSPSPSPSPEAKE